jgi:tRNA-splicing ligase RtcB
MLIIDKISLYKWRISQPGQQGGSAFAYADESLLDDMKRDRALDQLMGVASLPGIVGPALAMPDAHQGYGFPIGGVAAFDPDNGVISPGGVGYDINCGVRLLRSKLGADELSQKQLTAIADTLAHQVPAGVGVGGGLVLNDKELSKVLKQGAAWAIERGMGTQSDLEFCEDQGALSFAAPQEVSARALKRGSKQLGTLGAGNHFVELARVAEVYDPDAAAAFGLRQGQAVLWIHSGSRGLGHQVCDDTLKTFAKSSATIRPKDRQLVCAPPGSKPGRAYLGAMAAAANFAYANRQVLSALVRQAMEMALKAGPRDLGLGLVYDVAHNVAKLEQHEINGKKQELWVHRKGATRSLGPGHPEVPSSYRKTGQPVLVPGDMGRASFVLRGTAQAQKESFASSAHGAGRTLSRTQARKQARGRSLIQELAGRGILVRTHNLKTLAEEMPEAYKDASRVVEVLHGAGIALKVARTEPLVVIKG